MEFERILVTWGRIYNQQGPITPEMGYKLQNKEKNVFGQNRKKKIKVYTLALILVSKQPGN